MAKRKQPIAKGAKTTGATEPSPEEVAAVQNLQPLQMPEWYASGAQLVIAGNDVQLIFNKPTLLGGMAHGVPTVSHTVGLITPVGLVRMSMATLKDLSVLLSEQVEKREAQEGAIETDYTKQRALQSKEAASKKKH